MASFFSLYRSCCICLHLLHFFLKQWRCDSTRRWKKLTFAALARLLVAGKNDESSERAFTSTNNARNSTFDVTAKKKSGVSSWNQFRRLSNRMARSRQSGIQLLGIKVSCYSINLSIILAALVCAMVSNVAH